MKLFSILTLENWTELFLSKDLSITYNYDESIFEITLFDIQLASIENEEFESYIKENEPDWYREMTFLNEGNKIELDYSLFDEIDLNNIMNARSIVMIYFQEIKNPQTLVA